MLNNIPKKLSIFDRDKHQLSMFEKICIKSRELNEERLNISFLIDTMLFYGEVNILAHTAEMVKLLTTFGERTLHDLIERGRLKLHIRQNILGVAKQPFAHDTHYGVELFRGNAVSVHNILYTAHQQVVHNSVQNMKFADQFSALASGHEYDPVVRQMIDADFQNTAYLTRAVTEILHTYIPEYAPVEPLRIEIEKDARPCGPFSATYSVHSNIDFDMINAIYAKRGQAGPCYASLLLALVESRGDNYIAGQFGSEFATSDLHSSLMNLQIADVIQRTRKSEGEMTEFKKHVLAECPSIGEAFTTGQINSEQLLDTLEEGDKFREWLHATTPGVDLVHRYITEEVTPALSEKSIVKTIRVAITGLVGLIPALGPILGTVTSVIDTFFVDKLINGWKPSHFIESKLKPTLFAKSH